MVLPTKEQKEKMAALLKLQNTNGSFELNDKFAKTVGLKLDNLVSEKDKAGFDGRAYATGLAMEYIDVKLAPCKQENIKAFDKAKLFLFKVWADSQPYIKVAAQSHFAKVNIKGVDGDGRPIL